MLNDMINNFFKKNERDKKTFKYFKVAIPVTLVLGLILIKYTEDYFTLGIAFILLSLTMTVMDLYVINQTSHQNLLYIPHIDLVKHFINMILINPIQWTINIFNYLTLNYFINNHKKK